MQISDVEPGSVMVGSGCWVPLFSGRSPVFTVLGILLMDLVILFGLFIDLSSWLFLFFFLEKGGGDGVIEQYNVRILG